VPGVVRGSNADVFALGHEEATELEALPLPPEEAFQGEVIATSGNELLARFTMAPNYYLYRDRTRIDAIDVVDGSGAAVLRDAKLEWPPGKPHVDEHFGDVIVYYDVVEVPVHFTRTATDRAEAGDHAHVAGLPGRRHLLSADEAQGDGGRARGHDHAGCRRRRRRAAIGTGPPRGGRSRAAAGSRRCCCSSVSACCSRSRRASCR
jgi:hypothetical protein